MKVSKNKKLATQKFDSSLHYSVEKAVELVKDMKFSKFDETIDLAINLNVDPRHADENIRVTTSLPHGTGKTISVLVVCAGSKEKEALDAGADYAGSKEYIEKIKGGWTDVDKIVATPDMMGELGKLGRMLGPKGLMPNPKSGTVTNDVAGAVKGLKAGQVELRVEKAGIVHVICGKTSFENGDIIDNFRQIYSTLIKKRPASVKGQYIEQISISSTMGPGVKIDQSSI